MKNKDYAGMTEKQIAASFRAERLEMWLARQEFNVAFNVKQEAAARFYIQLEEWANNGNAHTVAPTFHLQPHVC